MNPPRPTADEPPDFSLVLGGPLYQLWRQTQLAGDALELLYRRVVVLALLAWLPLLLLSFAEGHAWGESVKLPFLYDIALHVRLLLALPLLILAEPFVHQRMRPVVGQFLARGLIPDAARVKFDAANTSAMRLRNSVMVEALLIAFVYVVGVGFFWRAKALYVANWYAVAVDGKFQPTLAGWWMGCVSLPVFQFLLLRWYFRLFIWTRFLWQVSPIKLQFMTSHDLHHIWQGSCWIILGVISFTDLFLDFVSLLRNFFTVVKLYSEDKAEPDYDPRIMMKVFKSTQGLL